MVTVFYSGRPLYVNEELMLSDAFVAAWLPGTEATGITDLLFSDGTYDFTGRLPYSWPANKCDNTINSTPAHLAHLRSPGLSRPGRRSQTAVPSGLRAVARRGPVGPVRGRHGFDRSRYTGLRVRDAGARPDHRD